MEYPKEAIALAGAKRGVMQAAAGCGKTTIISIAVASCENGRELVLTHTHAGLDALRRKLTFLKVPRKMYELETIAGWALRLAASFPSTSSLPKNFAPMKNDDYVLVYIGARKLAKLRPIQEIIRASYSGVYVDEYQDCTIEQHDLISTLADILPCRVVGDPLQGIFGFNTRHIVIWDQHVLGEFNDIPGPQIGWRWKNNNPELGKWLLHIRCLLLTRKNINLENAPINWIKTNSNAQIISEQIKACYDIASKQGGTIVAINLWPQQCHRIARMLRGTYSCIEPMDVEDLYAYAHRIDMEQGFDRAIAVIDFTGKCMTAVKTELKTIRTAFSRGKVPLIKKYKEQLEALLKIVYSNDMKEIINILNSMSKIKNACIYRKELLHEMISAVQFMLLNKDSSLYEATWQVRNLTRRMGRAKYRCVVGTPLLVKGLEYDHAIVLDAKGYNAKNLYVALTRGSKTLTIISESQVLKPAYDEKKKNPCLK